MITEVREEAGFADSFRRVSADSSDSEERDRAVAIGAIHFFGGEF